jgi:hypothetical protein
MPSFLSSAIISFSCCFTSGGMDMVFAWLCMGGGCI